MSTPSDAVEEPRQEAADSVLAPEEVIRSPAYRRILLLAAGLGILVSVACWLYLEIVHYLQVLAFETGPEMLGFAEPPWWWPLPILVIAGLLIGYAVERMPGRGGHEPTQGLEAGATPPAELPGILLATVASIALGFVLGPEAPLIALGTGLTLIVLGRSKRELPDEAVALLAAAASFAALATIFGSPIIGAVIILEAAGLGGARLRLVLLPGLIASGIGSLVFIGLGSLTGLSSEAYAISPLRLEAYPEPSLTALFWSIAVAIGAALVVHLVMRLGRGTRSFVVRRPLLLTPVAGAAIALLAIAYARMTGEPATAVLLSGQEAMNGLVDQAGSLATTALVLLVLFKALAWGISLGSARGGPTFPALFLGIALGILAGQLPGFAQTPAIAVLMGAMCVSILRLPLTAVVVALLVSQAGLAASPLVIVAVVVAYIATELLDARGGARTGREAAEAGA